MELDLRKMMILQAIIDDYIMTAAPIGSRTISKRADINLSSATIRNEMSDLEDLGFLEQPHTSAGRVPSDKAYRLYVNSIMQHSKLTKDEMDYIKRHFSQKLDDMEDVIKQTAWALADVTKYTSMVLVPSFKSIKLQRIQLIKLSAGRALAIIITTAGIMRDAVIRIPEAIGEAELEHLSRRLTAIFANKSLEEASRLMVTEAAEQYGEQRIFMDAVFDLMQKSIKSDPKAVELSGTTNILNYPEYSDMNKAKNFLSVVEGKDLLYEMLTKATKVEFSITIGTENENEQIQDCSVVTATYKIGNEPAGSLGIIGPTRMNYSKMLAMLRYIGKSLSEMLTNFIEEDNK